MQAQIEVNGVWHSCEFFSPHNQLPLKDILPGGVVSFRAVYTQYNAKLELKFAESVVPGVYKIRIINKIIEFSAERPEGSVVWGNVL